MCSCEDGAATYRASHCCDPLGSLSTRQAPPDLYLPNACETLSRNSRGSHQQPLSTVGPH
eukprot:14071643-Ditylum_brightwellii.AAC.1